MNIILLFIGIILVFGIMFLFYYIGKKDGLFLYIGLMSSILSLVIFKSIDILSFEINLGLTIIMGIFTASNIIIQKYGLDEEKKIISYFIIPFVSVYLISSMFSLIETNEFNLTSNDSYNYLFGYDLHNLRIAISSFISISLMLWMDGEIYYYVRKSKNNLLYSNIYTLFIVQFIGSLIFVFIAYTGIYDFMVFIGIVGVRYLLKVIIGAFSFIPIYLIVKKNR